MTLSSTDSGSLLSAPLTSGVRAEVRHSRPNTESLAYENTSKQFRIDNSRKNYNSQYFKVYNARLATMRPLIVEAAKDKFGQSVQDKPLVDLKNDEDETRKENILIIGTIFKQQERKPNILSELSEEAGVEFQPPHTVYTMDTDSLVLEDESMRVKLECGESLRPGDLVNGVVLGVWGKEENGGKFLVDDVVYAKIPVMKTEVAGSEEDVSVCVMSGLELGGEDAGWVSNAQMAVDWVTGSAGCPGEQGAVAKVERVIIAGDSLAVSTKGRQDHVKAKYLTANAAAGSIAAVRQLDDLLVQLVGNVNTDLMPGPNDPATVAVPQQALHRVMFRRAGLLPTLACVSNPYSCSLAGRSVLSVSGQTIADILRNSTIKDGITAMEQCLRWGHIAPTAPDTLGCYPYTETDPHILTALPDIFIAGNMKEFASKKVEIRGHCVLLVSVPKFSQTSSLVKINMKDLQSQLVSFDMEMDPDFLDR